MITRELKKSIQSQLGSGKAIILMGARQVGKSTLISELLPELEDYLLLNGDDADVQSILDNASSTRLDILLKGKKYLVIDEAQRIEDIGLKLKRIIDQVKGVQVIATGSSSFDLANKVNEPLTGRKREFTMYPLSFAEMANAHGLLTEQRLIPHRMVYGYYPEVVTHPGEEREILRELSNSYLYKDILKWEYIKHPNKLVDLLQALAYQVGSQVSNRELSQHLAIDPKTVERYLTLLEKSYIIFRLGSFSRNLRNELKRSKKVYFYDNGIRNAVIANFSQPEQRQDAGALWENFLISERIKRVAYDKIWRNSWFWRTTAQQEIDYIEEGDGQLYAYEMKWNPRAKAKLPKSFTEAYPDAIYKVLNPESCLPFLLKDNNQLE